jgi:nitroimidazol reductase NimA-like FMN-containing flavoprotein (pyridoxamine 5'-phosphate oxidase superfamily)
MGEDIDDEVVTVLSTEECWAALRADEFGRLASALGDEVGLVPVNYAVDDAGRDGPTLMFRTAEGSKLLGVLLHPQVVFEIDRYDEHEASSVIVRGRARRLEEDEAHRAEQLPLRPWVPTLKYDVVEIVPEQLSGRRFVLERPWLHARLDA